MALLIRGGFSYRKYNQNHQILVNKLIPYLKIAKMCGPGAACDINNEVQGVKDLNGGEYDTTSYYQKSYWSRFLLQDGSLVAIYSSSEEPEFRISIDTNGPQKGPNVVGRDIFNFIYYRKIGNKYQFLGSCYYSGLGAPYSLANKESIESCADRCLKDDRVFGAGTGCAARLLYKHKMDY